mmetsp:Transcript_37976/g.83267  ORF Transcript_37976/g.83267 Transcript_37976/m.83267 type:complete len:129 (+) Transcript_37976:52-438(+)
MAENFFTSRLPEYEGDGPTLRQQAARCCKSIDIGTAVLPKPLCIKDWDERTQEDIGGEKGNCSSATSRLFVFRQSKLNASPVRCHHRGRDRISYPVHIHHVSTSSQWCRRWWYLDSDYDEDGNGGCAF